MVSGGQDDGNSAEVVFTFLAVVTKNMIAVDNFIEYVAFELCFLHKVDV